MAGVPQQGSPRYRPLRLSLEQPTGDPENSGSSTKSPFFLGVIQYRHRL